MKFSEWAWDDTKGIYRGVLGRLDPITLLIAPNGKEVRELQWSVGKETVLVRYGDFEACCGDQKDLTTQVPFPYAVKVSLDKAKTSVQVQWDTAETWHAKAGEEAFQMALPEGTEVRRLK